MTIASISKVTETLIERDLDTLFGRLDSIASRVETRKRLYAELVAVVVELADRRLPNNAYLDQEIEKIIALARERAAKPRTHVVIAGQTVKISPSSL